MLKAQALALAWARPPKAGQDRANITILESDRRRLLTLLVTNFLIDRDRQAGKRITLEQEEEYRDLVHAALDLLSMVKRDLSWANLLKGIHAGLTEIGEV